LEPVRRRRVVFLNNRQKEPSPVKPKAALSKLNGPAKSSGKHTADKTRKSAQSEEPKDAPPESAASSGDARDKPKKQDEK